MWKKRDRNTIIYLKRKKQDEKTDSTFTFTIKKEKSMQQKSTVKVDLSQQLTNTVEQSKTTIICLTELTEQKQQSIGE